MTRFPRSILSGLITLALLPSVSYALGFGELVSQSAIGEPFKAQFSLLSVHPGDTEACLRVARSGQRDGIPDLLGARVRIRSVGGKPVAEVARDTPVSDPILRVTLEETCHARLKRTYTLLLPMAAVTPPQATAPAATPTAPRAPRASGPLATADDLGGVYTLPRAASLNAVARALYPSSSADRRAFISALKHANQGDRAVRSTRRVLSVGTTLILPTPAEVAQARDALHARDLARRRAASPPPPPPASPPARTVPPATATTAAAEATSPPAQAAPETDEGDRLVLMGGAADASGLRMTTRLGDPSIVERTSDTEREALRREQKLMLAIDSQIVANLELKDRIARLEALQDALRAELDARAPGHETPDTAAAGGRAPAGEAASAPPSPPSPTIVTPAPPAATEAADRFDWRPYAGLAVLALLGVWLWSRRRQAALEAADTTDETPAAESVAPTRYTVPEAPTRDTAEAAKGSDDSFDFSVVEWDGPPPAELDHSIAPIVVDEQEMAEEHESAVELADIMMSFGRVQGAAETLAEFIRGNPKKAVQPWIKLLEVYKAADMRGEFDALTDKLNKTFNVKTVSWDDFDEVKLAPDSVEQMPHIISMLQKEWMTRECQIYLQKLLRDNRGGTRQGFPLGVVDDLLMLQAVLEDQLGPYRMTDEELAAALAGTGEGGPAARSEEAPPAEANAGFVAPPQELAPDLDFEAPELSPAEPSGLEDTELFDLDHAHERTELPALDFQLDSGELDRAADGGSEETAEKAPEKAADDDSDGSDAPPDQTWLIPPPGKPD